MLETGSRMAARKFSRFTCLGEASMSAPTSALFFRRKAMAKRSRWEDIRFLTASVDKQARRWTFWQPCSPAAPGHVACRGLSDRLRARTFRSQLAVWLEACLRELGRRPGSVKAKAAQPSGRSTAARCPARDPPGAAVEPVPALSLGCSRGCALRSGVHLVERFRCPQLSEEGAVTADAVEP